MPKLEKRKKFIVLTCILTVFLIAFFSELTILRKKTKSSDNYVLLYFAKANSNTSSLHPQLTTINLPTTVFNNTSEQSIILIQYIQAVLEELIKGPVETDSELIPTIPTNTKVNSVIINENTAYIDFSREIVDDFWGGADNEKLTIYSIVNTVTQFSPIKQVQISVEGSSDVSIGGHYLLDRPFKRNNNLIQYK
ncbi:MAG TPA: GerMN domain-containing protein [Clostridia bacterium]|nr:GerMN domain-containing protein [Clostridia bacterium]